MANNTDSLIAARSIFRQFGQRAVYSPPDDLDFERWVIVDKDVQTQSDDSYAKLNERRTEISFLVEEGAVQRGGGVSVNDQAYTLIERIFDDTVEARYVARAQS